MRAWEDTHGGEGDKMTKMRRKGQEEIVGFVLIVVIVAVIFLVFLGLFLRQRAPATAKESVDVSQFIESMMEYTSDCAVSYEPAFSSIGVLVKDCNSGSTCKSGEKACSVLNRTLKGAIESNWRYGPDRPVKGYTFNSTYVSDATVKPVLYLSAGNCSYNRMGGEYLSPAYPGTIRSRIEICY